MTPTKVKKMLLGAAADKIAKYTAGGNTMKHEAGKDGVQLAMFVFGGVTKIKDGAELIDDLGEAVVSKLDEVAEASLNEISGAIEEIGGKSFNKALKEAEIDNFAVENYASTIADQAKVKGKKYTFEEIRSIFFKRGNDFNRKAVDNLWYIANEVVIEHPTLKYLDGPNKGKPKRFRLDSYNPNDVIVSRKATDLAEIQQSTFEGYLSELTTKYPVGAKIVNQERDLGATLQGKFILEIPESNRTFSKIDDYIKIAKDRIPSIEIVFKPE